jgi:hypothetical protein
MSGPVADFRVSFWSITNKLKKGEENFLRPLFVVISQNDRYSDLKKFSKSCTCV